jgi:xanthine dehydrogenase accessory factor
VTCPIGIPGIVGKQPEIVALSVVAQAMQTPTEPR